IAVSFGEHTIRRDHFLVLYPDHISFPDFLDLNNLLLFVFDPGYRNGKIGGVVLIETQRGIGAVLKSTPQQHKEHNPGHTVEVAGTRTTDDFIYTSYESDQYG